MSNYNIITEISEAIIKILKEGMVPEIIQNAEGIAMCHPSDKGDTILGINLYDIKRNTDIIPTDKISVGVGKQRNPSTFVDLYYMVTAYSSSDIKFRSMEEAKMLGRAIQLLSSRPVLREDLIPSAGGFTYKPKIELLDLENDEKVRLWGIPDIPYKLSLFYKVYPVEIDSLAVGDITRVTTAEFDFKEQKNY